ADDGARLLLLVLDGPHFGGGTKRSGQRGFLLHAVGDAIVRSFELEPRLVRPFENLQGEHRRVDVALDVADVVPRAFLENRPDPIARGGRVDEKQPGQSFRAITDRYAVRFEDI